LNETFLKHN
jgi:hypothetical protein